ncbi:MAG: restriction endonuclease subunit S [Rhodospirillaceae bacterium]
MDLAPGLKLTEVGVIPEDWKCATIGELVAEGVLEQPMDGNHGNIHPKSGDFVSFGIPFVMANNLKGGRVDLASCSFIRKEHADTLQKGFSVPGDVLLTHKATIGNTAVVGNITTEYIMLTPQITYYRVANASRLSNLYLRSFFDGNSFQGVLQSRSGGGTRSYIGITAQLNLPVALPPTKAEQEAIAEALSDADALIESLERLIAKKRLIKQGAMQELLTGKTRLPGFDGEWEVMRLGELIAIRNQKINTLGAPEAAYCVELEQIEQGTGQLHRYSDARSRQTVKYKFRDSDVLFGRLRPYLRKYWWANRDGVCSTEIWPITTPSDQLISGYLFQVVQTDSFIEAANVSYGTHMPRADWNAIDSLEIIIPIDVNEQTAIVKALSDMDSEISGLEVKLSKARLLKQGMMQELLTGRIRLV